MKRLFCSALLGVALLPSMASAAATDFYINNGTVEAFYPQPGPRVDATTFLNRGSFSIYGSLYPYDTWNTLNYTNTGYMYGSPGFRFDLSDSSMVGNNFFPQASANFVNASYAAQTAYIYGSRWLTVHATNVINSGTLGTSFSGLLKITGDNVDLTRGSMMAGDGRFPGSMYEDFWGIGTNRLDADFAPESAVSSPMDVMGYLRNFGYYNQRGRRVFAVPSTAYINKVAPGPNTDTAVDILIIGNDNPDVIADVRFEALDGPTTKVVRWEGYVTNRTTGVITTNQLFLEDRFPDMEIPVFITNAAGVINTQDYTVRPSNYQVTADYFGFDALPAMTPGPLDIAVFDGTDAPINVVNSTYGVTVEAALSAPDPTLAGSTYTNLAGRVEIYAKKVLNLTRSQISGATFVSIEGTNHFVGSAQSSIVAPFSSFKLTSTNSTLTLTNLLSPDVPCLNGTIEVWTGRWTNANEIDGTVLYNVTIVHSSLQPAAEPFVDELRLTAPNVVISDVMNVVGNSLINAESLTITANGPSAPAAFGQLNLNENRLVWTEVFPKLRTLTNNGVLTTANSAFFGGARTAPWFTHRFDEPYQAFVNTGIVQTDGNDTWARYFESTGSMNSGVGPLSIRADVARITDGSFTAGEDVSLNARSLVVSNQVITATRGINLSASGFLSDGSLEVGGGNETWNTFNAGNGIHLLELPPRASLLGTTVRLSSYANGEIPNRWAGADLGATPGGFQNNAAIGRLVLDGQLNSVFTFSGVTGNNAIYVNVLELTNFAAVYNFDETALAGVEIKPGMKIYFAKAIVNGDESVEASQKLKGMNGGLFVYVPEFTGAAPWVEVSNPGDGTSNQDPENPANLQPTLEYPTIPNPYIGSPTIVGSYQGLIYAPEGVTVAGSGAFKLSVNNRGVYTGRIKLGGKEYPISGKLDAEDHATISLASGSLTVAFDVDDSGEGKVEGTVTGAFGTSQIAADRIPNGAKTKSAYAGRYTVTIPAGEGYGSAYGTVLVTPASTLVLNLTLGDGTKLNQTLAVTPDGVWPLYASLNKGAGMILSWIKFDANTLGGKVLWINGDAYSRDTQLIGSRFSSKTANKRAIALFDGASGGYGHVVFSGSSLTDTQEVNVIIGKNNKVKFPDAEKVTLQILGDTGLFQGTFRIPGVSKPVSFKGAILQEQNYGAGLFIYNGTAGQVRLCAPTE